jgi:hypothetical protein
MAMAMADLLRAPSSPASLCLSRPPILGSRMLLSSGRGRVRGKGRKLVVAMAVEGERSEERAVQSEVQDQVWLRGSSVAAEFWCVLFI